LFKIILTLLVGGIGGFLSSRFFLPPSSAENKVVEVEKREVVQENTILEEAINKNRKVVVGIKTEIGSGKNKKIINGSGLFVTSDGLIIALSSLISEKGNSYFYLEGADKPLTNYQVLKRDWKNNLALVKVKGDGFKTCGFSDFNNARLGEKVFLIGSIFKDGKNFKLVNSGIIKFFDKDYIHTNMAESEPLNGSFLFNIKGELVGISMVDDQGEVFAVPVNKIRSFIGF